MKTRFRLSTKTEVDNNLLKVAPEKNPGNELQSNDIAEKISKMTMFKARDSILSLEYMHDNKNEFRGVLSLFWLVMACYFAHSLYTHNWLEWTSYYEVLFKDSYGVLITDLALIIFSYSAVILQKLVINGWLGSNSATFVKHILQTILIFSGIYVATVREWPWIQRSFLVPHTVVLFMKMHSFLTSHHEYYFGSKGKSETNQYVTFSNFTMYLLYPTLVYELNYPRSTSIRWTIVAQKAFSAMCLISLISITHQKQVLPTLDLIPHLSIHELIVHLMLPFLFLWVVMFFLIFDCICNFFAEITRFADKLFYEDWWNSVSFDEFARKWNKPVHNFLLRYVYLEFMKSYKINKPTATFITFLFSSCLHEMIMAVGSRQIIMYFFVLQMIQLPLIYVGRLRFFKEHYILANMFVWASLAVGTPLIAILYCREYYLRGFNKPYF